MNEKWTIGYSQNTQVLHLKVKPDWICDGDIQYLTNYFTDLILCYFILQQAIPNMTNCVLGKNFFSQPFIHIELFFQHSTSRSLVYNRGLLEISHSESCEDMEIVLNLVLAGNAFLR